PAGGAGGGRGGGGAGGLPGGGAAPPRPGPGGGAGSSPPSCSSASRASRWSFARLRPLGLPPTCRQAAGRLPAQEARGVLSPPHPSRRHLPGRVMSRQAWKRQLAAPSFALGIGALVGLVLLAAPTRAARLVAVRVAQHPGFARVVFESDAAVAFDVEPPHAGEPVRVHLAASCAARSVAARGAPDLNVQLVPRPEGGCIAEGHAPGPLRLAAQGLHPPA